jgi:hypothetical protein
MQKKCHYRLECPSVMAPVQRKRRGKKGDSFRAAVVVNCGKVETRLDSAHPRTLDPTRAPFNW